MTGEVWLEIKPVLADVILLPPGDREAFLCERIEDPNKRELARSYLRGYVEGTDPFSHSVEWPDSVDEPLPPGTAVGPYVVFEPIGQGGMARVYRGYDTRLKRPVALKVLLPSAELVDERARVLREARAAAQLSHSNVATIFDILEDGNRAFIVMEYLDGHDLAAVLRGSRLPIERALAIGRQLASALVEAHMRGVIHRDLKPGNIKVLRNDSVKVMDFGIAGLTGAYATVSAPAGEAAAGEEVTRRLAQPGTPGYMAPEQYSSEHFDARSDLFSLGIVLFEMVTGQYAYPDRRLDALVAAVHQPIRRADAVSAEVPTHVADLIARATAIDPAQRYATAEAFDAALREAERAVIRGQDLTPPGPLPLPPPTPPLPLTWRRALRVAAPWVLPAIAVVWALGALSTAWYDMILGREPPFRTEHWYSSLDYGRKSLFMPVLYASATIAIWWAGCFLVRVVRVVPVCDRVVRVLVNGVDGIRRGLKLDDARSLGQATAALALVLLAGIVWRFQALLLACATDLHDDASSATIALLASRQGGGPYRFALSAVLVLLAVAAMRISRLAAGEPQRKVLALAPVIAVAVLGVLLLQLPYRLLWHRNGTMVNLAGEACYLIGEWEGRGQVFCPGRSVGRTQKNVDLTSPSVTVFRDDKAGEVFEIWVPGPDGRPPKAPG